MHIQINNFHNTSSLSYDIEDDKINFLYGVSGSGKSSIVKAIAQGANEKGDIMAGCGPDDSISVLVNDKEGPLASTVVFNEVRQTVLFSREPEGGLYNVFIGNEEELDDLCTQYQSALTALRASIWDLRDVQNTIHELIKVVGRAKDGKLTKTSKMIKARQAYNEASAATREHIARRGMDVAIWLNKGFTVDNSYNDGTCPFCGRDIKGTPNENILEELQKLTVKDLEPLFKSPELLARLGQKPLDVSNEEGFADAKEFVIALPKVNEEIDHIIDYCNAGDDYKNVEAMTVAVPSASPELLSFMPELQEVMAEVNKQAVEIKVLLGKMKDTFNNLVRRGCRELNRKLLKFGIPYSFKITTANRDERTASYQLVHNDGDKSTDMHDSLSFGERNLITLILFLEDSDSEVMLIDDPASSYDDYRRTQIFKAITEIKDKTVLVVSHDQAFVRRAVRKRKEGHGQIGKIDMLCNRSGTASVEPIAEDSFGYFEDMIRTRIASSSTYYQQMLNIRLLCEIHGCANEEKNLWGYTSAILHRRSRAEVLELLDEENESEDAILKQLRNLIGSQSDVDIAPLPEEIDYSTDGFSEFERLIAKREEINSGGDAGLPNGITKNLALDLLNDLIHMNDAMMDCIDPYRYPAWSPILFKLLES